MKVKAAQGCHSSLTEGKVYEVVKEMESYNRFRVRNDNGIIEWYAKSHFTVVPAIEVGSEWVTNGGKSVSIKYIGSQYLIFTDLKNNDEQSMSISFFEETYKPKTKTVTMWFYECDNKIITYDEEVNLPWLKLICKKEIEL